MKILTNVNKNERSKVVPTKKNGGHLNTFTELFDMKNGIFNQNRFKTI
jgi:hypothetical protein